MTSFQDGLVCDTQGKAGLRSSSSLCRALNVLDRTKVVICVSACVCFKVFCRRATKDHLLHFHFYLYSTALCPPPPFPPPPSPHILIGNNYNITTIWWVYQCTGCLRFSVTFMAPPGPHTMGRHLMLILEWKVHFSAKWNIHIRKIFPFPELNVRPHISSYVNKSFVQ